MTGADSKENTQNFVDIIPYLITTGILAVLIAVVSSEESYLEYSREDGVFESLTAVFYLVSSTLLLFFCAGKKEFPYRKFLVFVALVFLAIFLEEISWGQRIFGFSTPGFLEGNEQEEANLHNYFSQQINILLYLSFFGFGAVLPLLCSGHPGLEKTVNGAGIPVVNPNFAIAFSAPFLFFNETMLPFPDVIYPLIFLIPAILLFCPRTKAYFSRIRLPRLQVLTYFIAGNLIFYFNSRNIVWENSPFEIREFLFSLAFLEVAVWMVFLKNHIFFVDVKRIS